MNENTKLKSPEYVLEKIKTYFTKERKNIFILTFILGLITHFLLLTNLIMSQDGLFMGIHYTAGSYETSLGRWGIDAIDSIRQNIALPFITTLISIVIMCFINILIIELLEIKSKFFKLFTILSVVASPGLCMTLLYVYTADAYLLAMLFSVISAYSLYKIKSKKIGILLSIVCFILTLSIYQSYMGITVGLILIVSVKNLLSQKNKVLDTLKDVALKAIIIISSAILYFFLTKLIHAIYKIKMAGYGGLNQISLFSILTTLLPSIKTVYISFLKYFFADGIILNRSWKRDKMYLIFFGLFALSMLVLFIKGIKNKENRKDFLKNYILSCLIIVLLPIAFNLVIILAPGNDIYYLTSTQMMLMFPFLFVIFELIDEKNNINNLLNWGISIISSVILFTYVLCCIVTYQTLELSYNQAKSIANRVLDKMELYEEYNPEMPVMFAGVVADSNFVKTLDLYDFAINNSLRSSIFHGTYQGHQNTWRNFYDIFLGHHFYFCEDYQYYHIVNSGEFKEMRVFPEKNSVRIIDGVMVVKFTDEPELPPWSQTMMEHGITPY